MNKFISHGFLPHGMLLGKIQSTAKIYAAKNFSSSNYRIVMNSSNLLEMFEYLTLPYLKKYLLLSYNQFAYRPSTGCPNAITLLNETISHYNIKHSEIFCAMNDLSQAYDRININTLCTKLRRAELPELITNIIEYMCRKTFVNTVYVV